MKFPKELLATILVIEALALAPFIANRLLNRDHVRDAILLTHGPDQFVYENYLRQAGEGAFAFFDRMTSEPQTIGILNFFWLVLGKLGALLHLEPLTTFTLARLLLLPALVIAIALFARKVMRDETEARNASLFTLGLSGIGWLIATQEHYPIDYFTPSSTIPNHIFASPHILLGTILLVALHAFFFRWSMTKASANLLVVGIAAMSLLHFQPYFLPILLATMAVWLAWIRASLTRRDILPLSLLTLSFLPPVLYHALTIMLDPFTSARYSSNITTTTDLGRDLFALSPILLLAAIGFRKRLSESLLWRYLLAWSGVALVMSHMPFAWNLRAMQSAFIPLGLAAYIGFRESLVWLGARFGAGSPTYLALRLAMLWLLFAGTLFTVVVNITNQREFALDRGITPVVQHLATLPNGVVLSYPNVALFITAKTHQTAYVAHWSETIDYDKKTALAKSLFFEPRDATETLQELQALDIRYLVVPNGSAISTGALTEIVKNDGFALFEVPISSLP